MRAFLFPQPIRDHGAIALLAWRLTMGGAMMLHGRSKIANPFHWMDHPTSDVAPVFQALAAVSEFFGGLAIALGLLTPVAAAGIAATMTVAALKHIRHGDAFVGHDGPTYELALGYLVQSFALMALGPGALSVDALVRARLKIDETL